MQGNALGSGSRRQCGTCTACCDGWLKIEVYGHQVDRGKPCPFSSGHCCTIYSTRPQDPCREFICGWLVGSSPLPEWMRPDTERWIRCRSYDPNTRRAARPSLNYDAKFETAT